MSFLDRFRRKKEDEASRFARLSKTGRITEGSVLDIKSDEQNRKTHVFYNYNIAGVEYESSQKLTEEQTARPAAMLLAVRSLFATTHANLEILSWCKFSRWSVVVQFVLCAWCFVLGCVIKVAACDRGASVQTREVQSTNYQVQSTKYKIQTALTTDNGPLTI